MNDSAARMSLPQIPEDLALAGITELVKLEQDWVPSAKDTSLYIRPFMVGLDAALACTALTTASTSSSSAPWRLLSRGPESREDLRGGPGRPRRQGRHRHGQDRRQLRRSLRAGDRAEANGYSQVLWLDGVHRKYIEEVAL